MRAISASLRKVRASVSRAERASSAEGASEDGGVGGRGVMVFFFFFFWRGGGWVVADQEDLRVWGDV